MPGTESSVNYPYLVVLYVPANRFKTQYVDAVINKNKFTDFLAFYMKMDVLISDDIQDLSSQASQNAFFNIFNHLHRSGKQLILTSDRPPVDLVNFEKILLSRFKWGLSVELQAPDYQTRLGMLKARAFREGVKLSDEVMEFLSKTRKRQIVQARQIAMYMSRTLINCSLSTIGSEIGGKDHATVLHACTTVSDLMSTDKTFKQYVTDIEKLLVPVRR